MAATKPGVMVVRQMLGGMCDAWQWDEQFAGDVKLALSEACNNVVVHAYQHEETPGELRMRLWASADSLVAAVEDDGMGIDATSNRKGLGLGLPLIHELADEVAITRSGDAATEILMRFTRNGVGDEGPR